MEEKRKFKRIPFKEPVQFRTANQVEPEACVACDLSEVGIRLNSPEFIPLGERVALTLQMNTPDLVNFQGHVAWIQRVPHAEYYQLGLAFDRDIDDQLLKVLQEYIQSH